MRPSWTQFLREDNLAPEVLALLAKPLRTRTVPMLLGHLTGLTVAALATIRVGGLWPTGFLLANLLVLVGRLVILRQGRQWSPLDTSAGALRWRRHDQAIGLIWAAVTSALCCCCVASDEPFTCLIAPLVAVGSCATIASRNASVPRYALTQLTLWLLPQIIVNAWIGSWNIIISVIIGIYLFALGSIVRQHYNDMRQLIDAERESRAVQATLAAREAELRAIFDNAAAGIIEWDLAGRRLIKANAVFCCMTGRSEAELLSGIDLTDMTHPEDRAAEAQRWGTPSAVGQTFHYEKRYVRPDGSIRWGHISAWVIEVGPDGMATRVAGVAQDCTQQKDVEAALRTSEEVLLLSLNVGRIGTYRRDYQTRLITCGLATRIMLGLPTDNEPVPIERWAERLLPEDKRRVDALVAAAHAEHRELLSADYRFIHPVDGRRHIETRARTTYDASGLPLFSVGVVIDVTERRLAEARIAHLAHHDPLTELPNRSLFHIRLDEALARARRGQHFALYCLDLDRFKDVNDTLGHPVGDALLLAVTARLKALIRPTDTVARLGGDEFALIQSTPERPSDINALAERLLRALAAPFDVEGYHVVIGTSIGIAITPDDGMEADALMRHADMALYAAKAEGRGCFRRFERHMNADSQARRILELELREALGRDEFELYYQPIVCVGTGAVIGFEALLRWHHPTRGLVPPDCFIPLAEAIGLLVPIGAWVLRTACAEAASWPGAQRVAVNLSAVQFTSNTLTQVVLAALQDAGLDPRRLELEITETAVLQDTEATLTTLHALKALGVTIAMDDFGTGYSSLGYLQRFPFDKVKIDRSFISDLGTKRETSAIVRAVIDMCRSLDMLTTAEGVETAGQLAALHEIGCTEAQGYYFSRPRPAADIPAMIDQMENISLLQPVD